MWCEVNTASNFQTRSSTCCNMCNDHPPTTMHTHTLQMDDATDYDKRQKIRKAIRDIKKAEGRAPAKRTGTAEYRRTGTFQPPKQITIPNSVTGNVLPDRLTTGSNKKEKAEGGKTISYLNATTTQLPTATRRQRRRSPSREHRQRYRSVERARRRT